MAEEGGLIGYGARLHLIYRQLAAVLVKVLHGIKPEDIPVEAPTKFDLVVNLKTAKALGLTIPESLLARADEVIEQRCHLLHCMSPEVALRDISRQRRTSVAFRAKRT